MEKKLQGPSSPYLDNTPRRLRDICLEREGSAAAVERLCPSCSLRDICAREQQEGRTATPGPDPAADANARLAR